MRIIPSYVSKSVACLFSNYKTLLPATAKMKKIQKNINCNTMIIKSTFQIIKNENNEQWLSLHHNGYLNVRFWGCARHVLDKTNVKNIWSKIDKIWGFKIFVKLKNLILEQIFEFVFCQDIEFHIPGTTKFSL